MQEHFENNLGKKLTISDEGILFEDDTKSVFFPYGSLTKKLKVGMLNAVDIVGGGYSFFYTPMPQEKERIKQVLVYAEQANRKAPRSIPKDVSSTRTDRKEIRMRCSVCGNVFCYSEADVKNNEKLRQLAARERRMAVTSALGTTIIESNQHTQAADRYEAQIMDFSKCPKCHSSSLSELTEEEFKDAQTAMNQSPVNAPAASPVDEIKKYKELLDSGIITQEEFDTKKKQLLGL